MCNAVCGYLWLLCTVCLNACAACICSGQPPYVRAANGAGERNWVSSVYGCAICECTVCAQYTHVHTQTHTHTHARTHTCAELARAFCLRAYELDRTDKHLYTVWPLVMAALGEQDKARVSVWQGRCVLGTRAEHNGVPDTTILVASVPGQASGLGGTP